MIGPLLMMGACGGAGGGGEGLPVTDNIVIWLESDAITGLSDNDDVLLWEDQSPEGNDASGASTTTGVYKTGIANGQPVVRFTSTDSMVRDGGTMTNAIGTQVSVYVVVSTTSTGAGMHIIDIGASGTPRIVLREGPNDWFVRTSAGTTQLTGIDIDDGAFHVVTLVATNNGAATAWIDGTQIDTDTMANGSWSTALNYRINGNTPDAFDLAAWLTYDVAHGTSDREAIEAYLSSKYIA